MRRTIVVELEVASHDEVGVDAIEDVVDRLLDAGAFQDVVHAYLKLQGREGVARIASATCHQALCSATPALELAEAQPVAPHLTGPQVALLTRLAEGVQTPPPGRLRGPWMRVANVLVKHHLAAFDRSFATPVLYITGFGNARLDSK